MAKQIKWNKRALDDFKTIAEYLEEKFSYQSAQNFVDQVYEKIDVVSKHPTIGRKAPKKKPSVSF